MKNAYKRSGVDIDAGNEFVERIKPFIASTKRKGWVAGIGGYGGLFSLDVANMKEPVLVSGTDGVGTKLKIAIDTGVLDTIGIDLVAMCVNDIVCAGAEPLFFLDYFATAKLKPVQHAAIVKGIAAGCKLAKCALIGGETAEMPDMYAPNDFDLAGFAVGIVDKCKIIDGSSVGIGQSIIGVSSSGFHSNGYSLVRRIIKDAKLDLLKKYRGFNEPLWKYLLKPTIIYTQLVSHLLGNFHLTGIAHITGGGFWDNIPRVLSEGVVALIKRDSWVWPEIFRFFQHHGSVEDTEMLRVFNCGIGMIIVCPQDEANSIVETASTSGYESRIIGQIVKRKKGEQQVRMV